MTNNRRKQKKTGTQSPGVDTLRWVKEVLCRQMKEFWFSSQREIEAQTDCNPSWDTKISKRTKSVRVDPVEGKPIDFQLSDHWN